VSTIVEYPWALFAAPAFALGIALLLWLAFRRRASRLARLGTGSLIARLLPPAAMNAPWPRIVMLGLAAACGAVAYAGPRWGMETTVQRSTGVDVVLVLDASLSMMAEDERPNRLERMKEEARRFLALSGGDRIGLIAFAGRAYVLSPLTVDHGALELFIDNLDPSVVGQAGSSIGRAIDMGTELLLATPGTSDKALIVMSDGEAFDGDDEIQAAAHRADKADIRVVTVGFGREAGATIPLPVPGGTTTAKRDFEGKVVVTRYTPATLQELAGDRGTFIPAPATDKAARVKQALAALRATGREAQRATDRRARFQLFLIPAVLLALFDTMLAERRGRRRPAAAASSTAVAAILLLAILPLGASAQSRTGDQLYAAGLYHEAADAYARAIQSGTPSPRLEYNLGTALLAAGQSGQVGLAEEAASALERAASESKDLDLRYQALYNLGLVYLYAARASKGQEEAAQAYAAATTAYRRALRLRPGDQDAKWNYELSNNERKSNSGGQRPSGGPPKPSQQIDPRQAQQLLNSAQREERETQAKKQKQNAQDRPPGGKDW
jgi:Ca-activated chloride channel family protein